jgi:hypothetical protein
MKFVPSWVDIALLATLRAAGLSALHRSQQLLINTSTKPTSQQLGSQPGRK